MTMKRYAIGREHLHNIGMPGITEQIDGAYVRHDDHEALMQEKDAEIVALERTVVDQTVVIAELRAGANPGPVSDDEIHEITNYFYGTHATLQERNFARAVLAKYGHRYYAKAAPVATQPSVPDQTSLLELFTALDKAHELDRTTSVWSNERIGKFSDRHAAWQRVRRLRDQLLTSAPPADGQAQRDGDGVDPDILGWLASNGALQQERQP